MVKYLTLLIPYLKKLTKFGGKVSLLYTSYSSSNDNEKLGESHVESPCNLLYKKCFKNSLSNLIKNYLNFYI